MKVPEGGLCGLVRGLLILIDGLISFSKGITGIKFLLDEQLNINCKANYLDSNIIIYIIQVQIKMAL